MSEVEKANAIRYNERQVLLSERTFNENPRKNFQVTIDGD